MSILGLWGSLVLGPPWGSSAPRCAGPADDYGSIENELGEFARATEELERVVESLAATLGAKASDPEIRSAVEGALDRIRYFPHELDTQPRIRVVAHRGMLVLAASLIVEDSAMANEWIERAVAREPASGADFGGIPEPVRSEYERKLAQVRELKQAILGITCERDCMVFVDGQRVALQGRADKLRVSPGTHDVWVFATTSGEPRGTFEEHTFDAGDQHCVFFGASIGLLPSVQEWWDAEGYARRLTWAMDCKKSLENPTSDELRRLLAIDPSKYFRIMARDEDFRQVRIRAYLTLADLLYDPDEPAAADVEIDTVVRLVEVDRSVPIIKVVGSFGDLVDLFDRRRSDSSKGPRGTLEFDCWRPCVTIVEGVEIDEESLDLAVGSYVVMLLPDGRRGDVEVRVVAITAGNTEVIQFGSPPTPAPKLPIDPPAPVDEVAPLTPLERRRWIYGAAGGVAMAGGVGWSLAVAGGIVPRRRLFRFDVGVPAEVEPKRKEDALEVGLLMAGPFVIHTAVAIYCFSRMPPSTRPGAPLIAAGGGLVATSAVFVGVGGVGVLSANDAVHRRDDENKNLVPDQVKLEEYRLRIAASTYAAYTGFAVGGAFLLSGIVTASVGAARAKAAIRARDAASSRRSVLVTPQLGANHFGVTFVGRF